MKNATYKFKCLDQDNFMIEFEIETTGKLFDKIFKRAEKKARDKAKDLRKFKEELTEFSAEKQLPKNLKTMFEGAWRHIVKKYLMGISKRAGLTFLEWWLDDMLFKRIDVSKWHIRIIFKGVYSRKY